MSETTTLPVLYILMRNDLASMNAGKAMAQASHASNAFVAHMMKDLDSTDDKINELYHQWNDETDQGFGTVLVLAVNEAQMRLATDISSTLGCVAGVVHDPTYPLLDGDVCHFLPIDTCAYVFADKNNPMMTAAVSKFPLHP